MQPHLPCGKALIRSIDTASGRCLHLGKIMSCLPWPGKHTKLVCSLMRLWYRVPEWECFDHDDGRGVFGRHGATQDQPVGDLGRSGRESAVAMEGSCRNAIGPPEWECEAMGSVVWVQCATSAECVIYR